MFQHIPFAGKLDEDRFAWRAFVTAQLGGEAFPVDDDLLADAPARVPVNDCLDALAVLWTAERWRDSVARTLPLGAMERPFIAT